MSERPILFSAPMVRAILSGQKTQTRRVIKRQPWASCCIDEGFEGESPFVYSALGGNGPGHEVHEERTPCVCPYGQPGDRLWVRESLKAVYDPDENIVDYAFSADGAKLPRCPELGPQFNDGMAFAHLARPASVPSIHMPRWASRITLEITGVRVERLQTISEADAQAEGCSLECMTPTGEDSGSAIWGSGGFGALWSSINGAESWDANPWVWIIEFKLLEATQAQPSGEKEQP